MWGCSRLMLVWSVILCITANSNALKCYTGEKYESCEGACFTMLSTGHGDVFIGNGCMKGEHVEDNECIDVGLDRLAAKMSIFSSHHPRIPPLAAIHPFSSDPPYIQVSRFKRELPVGSPIRDFIVEAYRLLGVQEGKVCFCKSDGCNQENRLSVKTPPWSFSRNGGSGFIPSVSLMLGVLCFLAWKSFAE